MKYKNIINILAAVAAVLGTAACDKANEKDFDPTDPSVWTIAVQPDAQTLPAEKGSVTYTFTAPDYWYVSSPVKWLTFEPESGGPGNVTLTVTVEQNTDQERNALVTVSTKYNRGKFTLTQAAWPYRAEAWVVTGTVKGGETVTMEDKKDKLVWETAGLPYHKGEAFKFRMGTDEASSLGLAGAFTPGDAANTYTATLRKGGENITLPENGYWDVTLDMSQAEWTVTAVLKDRFDWSLVGTVNEGDWTQDNAMTSNADKLVWSISRLPYHAEEEFKFRMDANDAFSLGLDGELSAVEGSEGTYTGSLKPDGSNITLPAEGFWDLTLDVVNNTLTAVFAAEFPKPEPNPLPWNWEALWLNDGTHGEASWNGIYRFGLEGHDGGNECVATFQQDVWDRIKGETFYVYVSGMQPQIRVTTGWWTATLTPNDIQPGNELLADNEAYTWILTVNLSSNEDLLSKLDDQHLLFTGSGFTVLGIYAEKKGPVEIDIAPFTFYEDRSATLEYPYFPSWSSNSGKLRIMRGGNPAIETIGLTTSSKFIVYKEAGTTGQLQWNDPNWTDLQAGCADWDGSAETIEVPVTESMLKCINGEVTDGWSNTALVLQGDGLKINKIVLVP